jgi:hypothetical protein
MTRLRAGRPGFDSPYCSFFSSLQHPARLQGPSIFLFIGYRDSFLVVKTAEA